MTKIGLITLGCDKNRVDGEKLLALALEIPHTEFTNDAEDADIIVINTCSFIKSSAKESIDTIFDMAEIKKRTGAKIVVTGCLANRYFDEVSTEMAEEVDRLIRIENNDSFQYIIAELVMDCENQLNFKNSVDFDKFIDNKCDIIIPNDGNKSNAAHTYLANKKSRILTTPSHIAYLKIADGCSNFCTYCTIPFIRGHYVSTDMNAIVSEAQYLIDNYGVRELNLVAQDVTKYGYDLYGKSMLTELLDKLSALEVDWIRLNYCYPELITDELLDYISKNPKICKYLDIPMQHVSTRVLKLMNRKSDYASLCSLVDKIRVYCPDISIRSTFIVGFPTETEEEFNELLNFIITKKLDNVGFFAYSKEENTSAARMKGQISEKVKKERLSKISKAQSAIMTEKMQKNLGNTYKILCDGIDYDKGMFYGRMEYDGYSIDKKVFFTSSEVVAVGEFIDVKLVKTSKINYLGEIK